MKKGGKIGLGILFLSLVLGAVFVLTPILVKRAFEAPEPVANSDVPVVSLAFDPRPRELNVEKLDAGIQPPLRLGIPPANRFILYCTIQGTAESDPGWRPEISAVEAAFRCKHRGDFGDPSFAEVDLRPVVTRVRDEEHPGGPTKLETRIEEVVSTMAWGKNHYEIRVSKIAKTVAVYYDKTGSHVIETDEEG